MAGRFVRASKYREQPWRQILSTCFPIPPIIATLAVDTAFFHTAGRAPGAIAQTDRAAKSQDTCLEKARGRTSATTTFASAAMRGTQTWSRFGPPSARGLSPSLADPRPPARPGQPRVHRRQLGGQRRRHLRRAPRHRARQAARPEPAVQGPHCHRPRHRLVRAPPRSTAAYDSHGLR